MDPRYAMTLEVFHNSRILEVCVCQKYESNDEREFRN